MGLGVLTVVTNISNRSKLLIDLLDSTAEVSANLCKALRYGTDYNSRLASSPSDNIIKSINDFNSVAEKLIKQLPRPPVSYMSKTVLEWFDRSSERDKQEFITTDFNNLVVFMPSIGNNIINHFNLWSYPWMKEVVNGVDNSQYHPENLALAVIKNVWRSVQDDA